MNRAQPYLVFEKFAQSFPIPNNSTKVAKFRRYEALDNTPVTLTEGVTPTGKTLTNTDVTATLVQYGDGYTVSDVILDTHEDPVLQEASNILGEQAAQMMERIRFGTFKAGSNVMYSGAATSRATVSAGVSAPLLRKAVRQLDRQNARKITSILKSTPSYETMNVPASFVAVVHPDLTPDLMVLTGWRPVEKYGPITPWENEIGSFHTIRFVTSTLAAPFADAGAALASGASAQISTTGTNADVYPILIIAKDSIATVPLKGSNALQLMVTNPKPSDSDPWAQRGHVTWKAMTANAILNDNWIIRVEVTALATPAS